ncbi:MAG: host attachment protein [Rhodospirillaceae bacterium]|nr:host attachment protein [Rhodospirillaceae bacterium]
MKNRKTWILVADGARARIVENNGVGKGLEPALNYEFAASRAPSRVIGTDKPGRGKGGGSHHVMDPKVDWHTFEKHLFAGAMADFLEKADNSRDFDALVLVAPPETLGQLRKRLNPNVKGKVTAELGKDFTHLNLHDLGKHLGNVIKL